MTTLEELLTMMAEDAAKAGPSPDRRPPPPPKKKSEAIGPDELEALDDGPVLTGDRLWPSALPQPARRGPPPPPPGRRARGTAPPDTSGLIDVRAMKLAYEQARAAEAAASEPPPAAADEVIKVEAPAAEPSQPVSEIEAPRPIIAEGTRPVPVVEEPAAEPEPEVEAKPEEEREERAAVWLPIARRAAVVVALGAMAALAVTFVVQRVRSEGSAAEPIDYTARLEPAAEPVAIEPAAAEPALQPVVIAQPTTIIEVGTEASPEASPEVSANVGEVAGAAAAETPAEPPAMEIVADEAAEPAVATSQPAIASDPDEDRPGRGEPPPELLADGCFDAACATTAPRVRRPAPPAAEMVSVPARLPTRPSNSEIASGIFAAQDQIDGCGAVYGTTGAVPLKIRIAPSGTISSVAVGEGTTRFRTCVADIVRRVRMPASLIGTTASFPVLIR